VRNGLRFCLPLSAALLVLVLAPSALGDETAYQLVVPPMNGVACSGFPHMTTDGTLTGCTPDSAASPWSLYSVAADGSVVFQTDSHSIWLVKPDGSSVLLDNSTEDSSPSISYDGSKVVFLRHVPIGDPDTYTTDIYSVNSDGSDLQLAVSGDGVNYLRVPVISPDGSTIAYWCGPAINGDTTALTCGPLTDGSSRFAGVMRANIDGSNQRMIVIGPGGNLESAGPTSLSWSPDSKWLAMDGLLSVDLGGNEWTDQRQLFEYHTDGSDLFDNLDATRQITHFTYDPNAVFPHAPILPQFSPDGAQLLYMDFIDGNGDQGNFSDLVGVDGSNTHQIFLNPNTTCSNGSCSPGSYGVFIPTATPVAPPPLVDMTHITVPPVTGIYEENAASKLSSVHLSVGTLTRSFSRTVVRGAVVSQFPLAGAVAHRTQKTGPPVNLVVSKGPPPPQSLNVKRSGLGFGAVSSHPAGISCGSTCSHAFVYNAKVVLTATAPVGSKFTGWSGPCSGTSTCTVTMNQARTVTATFVHASATLKVSKTGGGSGKVVSSTLAINCGSICSHIYGYGATVALTATPWPGSKFTGWSGACTGTGVCKVTLKAAALVTATFTKT
jgi:List-Bact-rpt repeat protein/PASTA domain-containing protein